MSIFNFNDKNFKLINYGTNENIYFKVKEIGEFLGYTNPQKAIRDHVWDSNKFTLDVIHKNVSFTPINMQMKTIYITEAGLYQLIFGSKMPFAEQFQKFVFEDVLPSIRKQVNAKSMIIR